MGGNLYESVFKKTEITISYPYSYSGSSNPIGDQLTYIVGREDLNKEIEINPYINDVLIFDFYIKDKKETFKVQLDSGKYTGQDIVSQLQEKISQQLNDKGLDTNMLQVQIGANEGDILDFAKPRISPELMRINTITIHKASFANKALGRLDKAIGFVSSERGRIGATQNRLESIIRNNENYEENLQASESRVRDLDMAKEMMEHIKQSIIHQASSAILAQANQIPGSVLQLLK